PSAEEEAQVVVRTTSNQTGDRLPLDTVKPVLNERSLLTLQQIAARQRVDDSVVDYAVRLTRATREWPGLAIGAGSRGAISLVRAARVVALLDGRDFITPDDIRKVTLPALRHRIALAPDALLEGRKPDDLLTALISNVAAPRT
ncbi:MAG TPA: MoxR family ATPase, partial [Povalibacter sp.]|nr:MoxR family ATPase [Povalibacter sp.]